MKNNKLFIFSFLYILISEISFSQIAIKGNVVDADDKNPLSNAEIFVAGLNKGDITDNDGNFILKDIVAGKITLVVSHIGYEPIILKFVCKKDTTIFIRLKRSVLKIPEVVVSAGVSTQHDNAISIDVLHVEEVFNSTESNVMTALKKINGVDLVSRGNGISQPIIRGMTGNNISVLVNGVRLENYQFSVNHPFMVGSEGLKKIEVIKGPASLLYGSGAMGGAVNFIIKDVVYRDTVLGKVFSKIMTNGFGTIFGGELNLSKKKLFLNLSAEKKNISDYFDAKGKRVFNSLFSSKSLLFNTGYIGKKNRVTILFRYLKPDYGLYVPMIDTTLDRFLMKPSEWYQDLTDKLVILSDNFNLGSSDLEFKLSHQINTRRFHTTKDALFFTPIDMTLKTTIGKIIFNKSFNEICEIKTGIEGLYQENINNNAPLHLIPDANIYNFALFAVAKLYIVEDLTFQLGARNDYKNILTFPDTNEVKVNNSYNDYSWSVGLTYNLFPKTLLRFNVASGYRTPSLPELTQNGIHGDKYEKGDLMLKPQTNCETDLGIHYHSSKFYFDVTAFINFLRNYIYLNPSNDTISGFPVYYYVQDDAMLYGIELSLITLIYDKFKVGTDFTYLRGKKNNGAPLPFIQQPKMKGKIEYKNFMNLGGRKYNCGISIMPMYAFEDLQKAYGERIGMPYFKMDISLRIGRKFKRYNLNAGVNVSNAFNNVYYDKLSLLSNYGFYSPGRNFSVLLKVSF